MAFTETYRKALAQKHLSKPTTPRHEAWLHKSAITYIQGVRDSVKKHLDDLDEQIIDLLKYSDKFEYKEQMEKNYIHSRAVLIGIDEALIKEIKSWDKFHTHHYK